MADMVAIILMVLVVVVLAAILFVLIRGYTNGSSSTPGLGTALALGTPAEAVGNAGTIPACSVTVCNFYNMSVQAASRPLELHDLLVQVIAQNGSIYLPPGGVVVINATAAIVGETTFGGSWTVGSAVPVTSSLTFVVYTSGTNPASLSGSNIRLTGIFAYSGTIEVHVY